MPVPVAVSVMGGVLRGLHAAHEARSERGEPLGIVHRDVSPQNVLIGIDGVTRLLDFGIAKASGRLQTTRDGTLKGKLSYMAPEQVRNEPIGPRTDLYAAAVILWELLTGHRLFHADSEVGTITQVLCAPAARPSSIVAGVSPSLDAFTLRGLQRDPSNRFGSAREMAAALDACIGVASTADIGAWVERTVGDDLRKRASRIAAIERAAAEVGPPPSGRDVSSGVRVSGVVARANALQAPDDASESPPPATAVQAGSPVRVWVVLASVAIVAAAALTGVARPKPAAAPPRRGEATPLAVSATAAPVIAPPAPEPPTTAVAKGPHAAAAPAVASPRRAAANPSAAPSQDCAQPYTTDAKGHVHFKPSCL
jgi:serine/threonine-protein kinase